MAIGLGVSLSVDNSYSKRCRDIVKYLSIQLQLIMLRASKTVYAWSFSAQVL